MKTATLIRAVLLASVSVVALAAFLSPARPRGVAAAGSSAQRTPAPEGPANPSTGKTVHGLTLTNSRLLLARIRATKAKGVLIGAWASWCEGCKEDVPLLLRMAQTFPGQIEVILVSVDDPSSEPEAANMLAEFRAPEPRYVVAEDLETFKPALHPEWPGMLPASFLFDGTGKRRYYWGGPVLEEEIVPLLKRYLAGEVIDGEANFALAPGAVTR